MQSDLTSTLPTGPKTGLVRYLIRISHGNEVACSCDQRLFFSSALCASLTRLRREISIRKKYPLEPRVHRRRNTVCSALLSNGPQQTLRRYRVRPYFQVERRFWTRRGRDFDEDSTFCACSVKHSSFPLNKIKEGSRNEIVWPAFWG